MKANKKKNSGDDKLLDVDSNRENHSPSTSTALKGLTSQMTNGSKEQRNYL